MLPQESINPLTLYVGVISAEIFMRDKSEFLHAANIDAARKFMSN